MSRWRWWICGVALIVVSTFWADLGRAALVRPVELAEITERSSHIVRGTVVSLESRWNEARTLIYTDATIAVTASYKGSPDSQVVLRVPGGTVEDIRVDVSGSPTLEEGKEIVVFADAMARGILRLSYVSTGVYFVERDSRGTWLVGSTYPVAKLLPGRAPRIDVAGRLDLTTFEQDLTREASRLQGGAR